MRSATHDSLRIIALNAFVANLKQVSAYLHDETVRREAQHCVEKVITDQTRVLVGHSLGTVVAYEALCAHPEWPVRTFVSLGSPLGISILIFELLRPAPEGHPAPSEGRETINLGS